MKHEVLQNFIGIFIVYCILSAADISLHLLQSLHTLHSCTLPDTGSPWLYVTTFLSAHMKVFIFRPAVTIISILSNIQLHILEYTHNQLSIKFTHPHKKRFSKINTNVIKPPSLMIIASESQFHIYLPCLGT